MYSVSSANNLAKRFLTVFILGAMLLFTATLALGQNLLESEHIGTPDLDNIKPILWVEGQVVVKFSEDADVSAVMSSMPNFTQITQLGHSQTYLFEMAGLQSPWLAPKSLASMSGVEWVQPNYVLNRLHAVQGSYPFGDIQKVGSMDDQDIVDMLDLTASHNLATGYGTTVAVIDGGLDIDHPALEGSGSYGHDYVDGDETSFDVPDGLISGHGTFVAGLIHLTAPDAQIIAYRVIDENGYGDGFSLAQAIEQAVDDGCRVINISLVLVNQHLAVTEAIDYANSMGVTVVCAAGNNATDEQIYPAADNSTIAVAAVDSQLSVADFSSFGAHIDVCAPATWAYSAYQHQEYAWWSGTSFAAPLVSGQVAMLLEQSPLNSPEQILSNIISSCTNIDATNPGYLNQLGNGLVSPLTALIMSGESAELRDDTISFIHYEGQLVTTSDSVFTLIASTNAPALWTAEIVGGPPAFFVWFDSVGFTNESFSELLNHDTTWIAIDPYLIPEGEYYVTIRYSIEGVTQPVDLTIALTVLPKQGSEEHLLLYPSNFYFEADLGSESILIGEAVLSSSNAPVSYMAELFPGDSFTTLLSQSGETRDTVRVSVDPSSLTSVGLYVDTVVYYVEGVDYPGVMHVRIQINDPNLPTDTGWVWPATQTLTTSPDLDHVQSAMIVVGASGEPHEYTFSLLDDNDVIVLAVPFEPLLTNDSLIFEIQSGYGRAPGLYSDTLIFTVDGISNNPLMAVFNLIVDTSNGGSGTASAWPYAQYFEVEEATPFNLSGAVFLNYSMGSVPYTASVVGTGNFLFLNEISGMTGDSIWFSVNDSVGLDSGIYVDTIRFDVDGAANSPVSAIVYLAVGGAGSGYGVPTVTPVALAFYGPEGEPFSRDGRVSLTVSKEPHDYTVSVSGINDFTTLIDIAGTSDDSISFTVGSDTGLTTGVYVDSIRIDIPNASPSTKWVLLLLEISDSSGTNSCCTMVGDLNGNGLVMEWADTVALSQALVTGNVGYLDCMGTADINLDCVIDINDLDLMKIIIMGDSIPFSDCGTCSDYTFIPTDSSGSSSDTCWVSPATLSFNVPYQSLGMFADWVHVFSTNAPAGYVAWVLDGPAIDPNSFVQIADSVGTTSVGTTNDSISIGVSADGLAYGTYLDTVVFDVAGTDFSAICIVTLNIGADSISSNYIDDALLSNYPNPFNPVTTISYSLQEAGNAELSVFNVLGQRVVTLVENHLPAGTYQVEWNGTNEQGQNVASGIYLYRLKTDEISVTKKMILLK